MAIWVLVLFLMGLLALVLNYFGIFEWFTPWWAMILMVIALGMFMRIWNKEKAGVKESLAKKIIELETQLKEDKNR